ncbi:TerD family protein, partial [Polaribacter sp. BAL334]|uniref:TerD family protein n=1 Tax=Polaribacter sp. BAL334 TaxID=1708178 RepID=UPI0018D20889
MAINLKKGQTIDLRKNEKGENVYDLSTVTIGLGWDVKQKETSFFGKLLGGGKEEEYDLDAIAFLLDSNGKVANLGRTVKLTNGQEKG